MKKFLVRLSLFVGIVMLVIGGFCALEIICEIRAYHREIVAPEGATVLACGDSQMEFGINPEEFPAVFNFSSGGKTLDQVFLLVRDILTANADSIKTVLIDVSPVTVSADYELPISRLGFAARYWLIYCMHWGDHARDLGGVVKVARDNLVGRRLRVLGRAIRGKKVFSSALCGGFSESWESLETDDVCAFNGLIAKVVGEAGDFGGVDRSSGVFKWLDKIIDCCHEHGADAVLITTPWKEVLRERFESEQLREFSSLVAEYANARNCLYFDFLRVRFDGDCWHDANHLNSKGAKIFTGILRDELIRRGLDANSL